MNDQYTRKNLEGFYDPVKMPGGWTFNHSKQIDINNLYYAGKYATGQYDDQGFRKFFYNIIKPSCDIARKFVDLDVKNIIISSKRAGDEWPVFFMQRRLKQYLQDTGFGDLLNEIAEKYPKEHVVLKKVKGKFEHVNVENLRMDTTAQSLKKSSFVYEVIRMSRGEIQKMNYDSKELFDRYPDQQEFYVYECYHKDGEKWNRTIKADLFSYRTKSGIKSGTEAEINEQRNYLPAIILDESEDVPFPYRELKWEDIKGRWLAYTYPELLEDNQIATNEAENLERKGLQFTSLKLYQTRDESIGGSNVLTGAQNGDILKVNHELTPVAMEERNLGAYNSTRQRWDTNTERKTFSFDIARGENLPSRTPVGVANLSASMVTSFFELKRQKFGLFIKQLLIEDILPGFHKDTAAEHELMIAGSDEEIERLDRFLAESIVQEAANQRAMETGFEPNETIKEEARIRVTKELKKKINRYMKVMKDYYKNAKYIVDVNVVGESFDLNKNNEGINFAMQMMNNNPAVLQNPVFKALFFELLTKNGFSPAKLNMLSQDVEKANEMPLQPGGSMARPTQATGGMTQQEQLVG